MNATTQQAEGWQADMRSRNAAVAQMARQIKTLEAELAAARQENAELRSLLAQ